MSNLLTPSLKAGLFLYRFLFHVLRLTLGTVFEDAMIWADFWEETTELMFVLTIVFILWIYRNALLNPAKIASTPARRKYAR